MKAMILAAGFGTRFRPVTHTVPKPMIPVLNRPLLGWAVEACLEAGFDELIVNLHHIPKPIRTYLADTFGKRASFELSDEEEILGTGGALRRVRHLLRDDFVLVNGDTIQWPPFRELIETRKAQDAVACLLLRHAPPEETFTRVWLEEDRITGFGEGTGEPLMFAGVHAMSPSAIDLLPDREVSGLTEDLYIPATKRGDPTIAGYVRDGLWFDVGKPTRYMEATAGLLQAIIDGSVRPPSGSALIDGSLIERSAIVEGEADRSSVGSGSRVGSGASLDQSILWDDVSIGRSSSVRRSIIGHGVAIPEGSVIENLLVATMDERVEYEELSRIVGDWTVRPIEESEPWTFEIG